MNINFRSHNLAAQYRFAVAKQMCFEMFYSMRGLFLIFQKRNKWLPVVDYLFINTLRPRQDERYFTDDNFKCTFLNESIYEF